MSEVAIKKKPENIVHSFNNHTFSKYSNDTIAVVKSNKTNTNYYKSSLTLCDTNQTKISSSNNLKSNHFNQEKLYNNIESEKLLFNLNITERSNKAQIDKEKHKIIKILYFLANTLEDIILDNTLNEKECPENFVMQNKSVFYSAKIPEISIIKYLARLIKLSKPEMSTCILLCIYIDRFCENSCFHISINNVHK